MRRLLHSLIFSVDELITSDRSGRAGSELAVSFAMCYEIYSRISPGFRIDS